MLLPCIKCIWSLCQVDIVKKMVTALSGGKGRFNKETLAVLTTTEAQKSLIQSLLQETNVDESVMEVIQSQVMTISASRGMRTVYDSRMCLCVCVCVCV